jgi:hypothetical protein
MWICVDYRILIRDCEKNEKKKEEDKRRTILDVSPSISNGYEEYGVIDTEVHSSMFNS